MSAERYRSTLVKLFGTEGLELFDQRRQVEHALLHLLQTSDEAEAQRTVVRLAEPPRLGHSAGKAIEAFGIYGLVAVLLAIVSTFFLHRRHTRHTQAQHTPPPEAAPPDPEAP